MMSNTGDRAHLVKTLPLQWWATQETGHIWWKLNRYNDEQHRRHGTFGENLTVTMSNTGDRAHLVKTWPLQWWATRETGHIWWKLDRYNDEQHGRQGTFGENFTVTMMSNTGDRAHLVKTWPLQWWTTQETGHIWWKLDRYNDEQHRRQGTFGENLTVTMMSNTGDRAHLVKTWPLQWWATQETGHIWWKLGRYNDEQHRRQGTFGENLTVTMMSNTGDRAHLVKTWPLQWWATQETGHIWWKLDRYNDEQHRRQGTFGENLTVTMMSNTGDRAHLVKTWPLQWWATQETGHIWWKLDRYNDEQQRRQGTFGENLTVTMMSNTGDRAHLVKTWPLQWWATQETGHIWWKLDRYNDEQHRRQGTFGENLAVTMMSNTGDRAHLVKTWPIQWWATQETGHIWWKLDRYNDEQHRRQGTFGENLAVTMMSNTGDRAHLVKTWPLQWWATQETGHIWWKLDRYNDEQHRRQGTFGENLAVTMMSNTGDRAHLVKTWRLQWWATQETGHIWWKLDGYNDEQHRRQGTFGENLAVTMMSNTGDRAHLVKTWPLQWWATRETVHIWWKLDRYNGEQHRRQGTFGENLAVTIMSNMGDRAHLVKTWPLQFTHIWWKLDHNVSRTFHENFAVTIDTHVVKTSPLNSRTFGENLTVTMHAHLVKTWPLQFTNIWWKLGRYNSQRFG